MQLMINNPITLFFTGHYLIKLFMLTRETSVSIECDIKRRFATLGSMRGEDDGDDSSDEEGQAFYAGGSERGG